MILPSPLLTLFLPDESVGRFSRRDYTLLSRRISNSCIPHGRNTRRNISLVFSVRARKAGRNQVLPVGAVDGMHRVARLSLYFRSRRLRRNIDKALIVPVQHAVTGCAVSTFRGGASRSANSPLPPFHPWRGDLPRIRKRIILSAGGNPFGNKRD